MKSGELSVRKPSLAIREGALGYRTPQLLLLPSVQWPPWRLPRACGQNTPPPTSPPGAVRGGGCARPAVGLCDARCLLRPAPPPSSWGRVPLGPAGRLAGGGDQSVRAPCVRAVGPLRCGEPWGKGGKVLGA